MNDMIKPEPGGQLSNETRRPVGRPRVMDDCGLYYPMNDGKDPTGAARQHRWRQRHPEQHAHYQRMWRVWGSRSVSKSLAATGGWSHCPCPLMRLIRSETAYRAIRVAERREAMMNQLLRDHGAELIKRLAEKPAP